MGQDLAEKRTEPRYDITANVVLDFPCGTKVTGKTENFNYSGFFLVTTDILTEIAQGDPCTLTILASQKEWHFPCKIRRVDEGGLVIFTRHINTIWIKNYLAKA